MSYTDNFPYLYSNPSGSPEDHPITFSLADVYAEFPGHTVQTNSANNAVGLFSNDRPYGLPIWSTPNTGQWTLTPYVITYNQHPPVHCIVGCDPTPVTPPTATPEPAYLPLMFLMFLVLLAGRLWFRNVR